MSDRAQLDGGLPMRYRVAPTAILVLIVIGAETSIATALSIGVVSVILWCAVTIPSYMLRV